MKSFALGVWLLALPLIFNGCKPRTIDHGVTFVLAVKTTQGADADSNEAHRVMQILEKRINQLGFRATVETAGSNRITVKLDPESKEQIESTRRAIVRGGSLEFRLVHEDNKTLMEQGIVPPGYAMLKERRAGVGGQTMEVPYLVSKTRLAGLTGKNLKRAAVGRDPMNKPEILFEFDEEGSRAFEQVTTTNVNRILAIIVDSEVSSAPVIRSAVPGGRGAISGSFTDAEARDLANALQSPLDAVVELVEERRF